MDENRPKRETNDSKQPSKASKTPNSSILKNIKKTISFLMFLTTKASQESLKRPKKAPKRHPKNSKTPKKGPKIGPKNYKKLDQFWGTLGKKSGKQL